MMNDPELRQQKIEDYLLHHMDEAERQRFAQAIDTDPNLAKAVEDHQKTLHGIAAFSRKKLRQRLDSIHHDMETDKPSSGLQKSKPILLLVIATILLILLSLAYFWWNRPVSPKQLYAQYFHAPSLQLAQRNNGDAQLLQLEQWFQNKDYAKTLPLFDSLLQAQTQSAQIQIAAGIARMELNQAKQALAHFQSVLQSDDFLYRDQARWYAALAYLQLNNLQQSQLLLQILADDPEADFHQEAKELLQKIK